MLGVAPAGASAAAAPCYEGRHGQGGHAPGLQVLTLLAILVLGLLTLLALQAMKGVMAREVTQLVFRFSVYLLS